MDDFIKRLQRTNDEDNDNDENGGAVLKGGNKPYVALAILLIACFF